MAPAAHAVDAPRVTLASSASVLEDIAGQTARSAPFLCQGRRMTPSVQMQEAITIEFRCMEKYFVTVMRLAAGRESASTPHCVSARQRMSLDIFAIHAVPTR